ncbi:MAG: hypothetical protein HC794_07820 [Nitrospiraceae bacterium]|nr:hypothetical protein [Nitrospiraceae bacterium]
MSILPILGEKPIGAPATIAFEGDVTKADALTVKRVELILPSIRIPAKGSMRFGDPFSIDASVTIGALSLSRVPEWISKSGFEAGNIEVSLDVKGKGKDWQAWRITGWMALTNGLMAGGAEGPIQDLYARVKLVRNGAEIKRLSFKIHDSDVALEATVKNWTAKPVITGKIESNQLDLDLLIPKGDRSVVREFLEDLAATSRVTMAAAIARGHYKHMKFGGLSARVNIQGRGARCRSYFRRIGSRTSRRAARGSTGQKDAGGNGRLVPRHRCAGQRSVAIHGWPCDRCDGGYAD